MEKTLNSTSLVTSLIPPLGIFSAVTYFLTVSGTAMSGLGIAVVIFGYVWSTLWVYGAIKNTYHLFYDNEFIYLKGYLRNRKVPFTDVARVQLTNDKFTTLGITNWKYRIMFAPHTNLDDQYFWDVVGGTKADEFAAAVKLKNERVEILHHS